MKNLAIALLAGSALFSAHAASAAVIAGPTLDSAGSGWIYTGLSFHANQAATLTGFTFQNQGQADTVVLTDMAGNVLQSLATPGGVGAYVANVTWTLTAGADYRLLQTTASNEYWTYYGGAAPSNADISLIDTGTFSYDIHAAGISGTDYWAAFNGITTASGAGVPEPATWALMIMGFGLVGATARSRKLALA